MTDPQGAVELSPQDDSDTDAVEEEAGAAPTFILLLAGEAFADELALLRQWVDDLLVPTYLREPSPTLPWCPLWWEHEEALARLHALWLAWQELSDPEAGGWTGPSTWHRDHLDPALRELRSPEGPLWRCMTSAERPTHRPSMIIQTEALQPHAGFAPAH